MFRIIPAKDYLDMCHKAAHILSAKITLKPGCVLGLATGSTPVGIYRRLIEWYEAGDLDLRNLRTVNLDEYKGLGPEHPQSYHRYMRENFFDHVNIDRGNTYLPDGSAEDAKAECRRYNGVIAGLGGIDMQLLGIGENGHIGFNEPGEVFEGETHLIQLSDSTIQANARFFDSPAEVPTHAYTMGIKSIMGARSILLAASGEKKADALYQALYGPITPALPASVLQLHGDVTVVADTAAMARCQKGK